MTILNILDFNPGLNNKKLSTSAIQNAIDKCDKQGGGTVIIPEGRFMAGAIRLHSNINLHLESSARLIASPDYGDFKTAESIKVVEDSEHVFIFAKDCENISITGNGMIDGNAEAYMESLIPDENGQIPAKRKRPRILVFENCRNVKLEGFLIYNAPMWTIHPILCEHVIIRGISILNNKAYSNNDAIDPDRCNDVLIENCHIVAGDDAIVLKTSKLVPEYNKPCENVIVKNCSIESNSCAIKIGTESYADYKNCEFSDCVILDSNRAIGIFSRDGGNISNMKFRNMIIKTRHRDPHFWGKAESVFLSTRYRVKEQKPGYIKNITFENIEADSENGIQIHGIPDSRISNISFKNLRMKITYPENIKQVFDIRPPMTENSVFTHPVPAIYAAHVDGLAFEDIQISEHSSPSSMQLVDVNNITTIGLKGVNTNL